MKLLGESGKTFNNQNTHISNTSLKMWPIDVAQAPATTVPRCQIFEHVNLVDEVPSLDIGHHLVFFQLLSGQRLCPWKKKCNYVTVDIQTFGIKHDCGKMKQATVSSLT